MHSDADCQVRPRVAARLCQPMPATPSGRHVRGTEPRAPVLRSKYCGGGSASGKTDQRCGQDGSRSLSRSRLSFGCNQPKSRRPAENQTDLRPFPTDFFNPLGVLGEPACPASRDGKKKGEIAKRTQFGLRAFAPLPRQTPEEPLPRLIKVN
jgi:hypothetical protein